MTAERAGPAENDRYSFNTRYGPVLLQHGIGTYPDALVEYRRELLNPRCARGCRFCDRPMTTAQFLFVLAIFKHRYSDEPCWPSTRTIADYWEWDYSHAQKVKNSLEAAGWLLCQERVTERGRESDLLDISPLLAALEELVLKHAAVGEVDLPVHARPRFLPARPRKLSPVSPAPSGHKTTAATGPETTGGAGPRARGASGRFTGAPPAPRPDEREPIPELPKAETMLKESTPEYPRQPGQRAAAPGLSPSSSPTTRPQVRRYDPELEAFVAGREIPWRDDDPSRTMERLHHVWWNSHLPLQVFRAVVAEAREHTERNRESIRLRQNGPGVRGQWSPLRLWPYFFAVLDTLIRQEFDRPPARRAAGDE